MIALTLENFILRIIIGDGDANPVKVEALRGISGVVRNHCPAVLAKWNRLGPLLRRHVAVSISYMMCYGLLYVNSDMPHTCTQHVAW